MSSLFHEIEGSAIVLVSRGVYRQTPVYQRKQNLFAKWGGGFIGLMVSNKGTTLPKVSWDHIEGVEYVADRLGRMIIKES